MGIKTRTVTGNDGGKLTRQVGEPQLPSVILVRWLPFVRATMDQLLQGPPNDHVLARISQSSGIMESLGVDFYFRAELFIYFIRHTFVSRSPYMTPSHGM